MSRMLVVFVCYFILDINSCLYSSGKLSSGTFEMDVKQFIEILEKNEEDAVTQASDILSLTSFAKKIEEVLSKKIEDHTQVKTILESELDQLELTSLDIKDHRESLSVAAYNYIFPNNPLTEEERAELVEKAKVVLKLKTDIEVYRVAATVVEAKASRFYTYVKGSTYKPIMDSYLGKELMEKILTNVNATTDTAKTIATNLSNTDQKTTEEIFEIINSKTQIKNELTAKKVQLEENIEELQKIKFTGFSNFLGVPTRSTAITKIQNVITTIDQFMEVVTDTGDESPSESAATDVVSVEKVS